MLVGVKLTNMEKKEWSTLKKISKIFLKSSVFICLVFYVTE